MKLELKHLAPYLPYGLKIKNDKSMYWLYQSDGICRGKDDLQSISIGRVLLNQYKPILRPLSDLTKEITNEKNQTFIFVESLEIGEDDNGTEYTDGNIKIIDELISISKHELFLDVSYLPYLLVKDLIENYFDIFGLIPKGLAIDKNTL